MPITVSVKLLGLQYGVDGIELDGAERDATVGSGPAAALIVKRTMFDTSVVVVALVLEVAATAEPGIWTATFTVPGAAISEAGTVAVNVLLLTKVVSANWLPFHKMNAPGIKPLPVAVMAKPDPPAVAVWGPRNDSVEEDV